MYETLVLSVAVVAWVIATIGHYVSIGHLKLIARPAGLSKPISGFFPDPEIRRNRASRPSRCLARTSASTIPEPVVRAQEVTRMCRSTISIEADRVRQLHQGLSRGGTSDRVRQHPRRLPVEHRSCLTADPLARRWSDRHGRSISGPGSRGRADIDRTSSGDDLSRQIEFLYSRHRLNAAISERHVGPIVASSRRLETSCSMIEQPRLVMQSAGPRTTRLLFVEEILSFKLALCRSTARQHE